MYDKIIDYLFGYCVLCSAYIRIYPYICLECSQKLMPYGRTCCCQKQICECLTKMTILYQYTDIVQNMLLNIKYYDNFDIIKFLSIKFLEYIDNKNIVLVPVPTSRKRLLLRGYNQSVELCRFIAKYGNLKIAPFVFKKTLFTIQANKSYEERQINAQSIILNDYSDIINTDVIIVDDLVASGATITRCVKLIDNIAHSVEVFAITKV